MSDRTGWFGAAVLAAAIAAFGVGCASEEPREPGAPSLPEQAPAEPGAPAEGVAPEMEGTQGEEIMPREGEMPAAPAEAGPGEVQPPAAPTEGAPPAEPVAPPAEPAAPLAEPAAPPAPTELPPPAAPAVAPNVVELDVVLKGEGAARQASVKSGAEEVATFEVLDPPPATPVVSEPLVKYLESKKAAIAASGAEPRVVIVAPLEAPFNAVGLPVMKAAFRAGFKPKEVEYRPGGR